MKNFIALMFIILCISNLSAQISSNCIPPSILQVNYDVDVKHLTLKRIFEMNSPYKDSIVIQASYQDTIWQGLAAIFNSTFIVERDSVFNNYCIHNDVSNFLYQSIYVKIDTSYSWTNQWKNLNITTGITALDNFLSAYGFYVSGFSTFVNVATLSTNQNINIKPLCDSIENYSGIVYSEPKPIMGSGNEITYDKTGNDQFYNFTVGYGDCPSGCTGKHIFKFQVHDDCSVDYLGTDDIIDPSSSIPIPVNCNIATKIENKTDNEIFLGIGQPNPFSNSTVIPYDIPLNTTGEIIIYNTNGLALKTYKLQTGKHNLSVDLRDVASGVYSYSLQINGQQIHSKRMVFVK